MILFVLLAVIRLYHPVDIQALTAEGSQPRRTHVEVSGFLTMAKKEGDGDWHLRICDSPRVEGMDRKHCIVAEIIPAMPCRLPRIGNHVRIRGISRFDGENGHGWSEIHPIESLEIIP